MTSDFRDGIEASLHSDGATGVIRIRAQYETDVQDLWSAISDSRRLADWYGKVEGDLHVGGEFAAFVYGSEWEGRGRIDACSAPRAFRLTESEEGGPEVVVAVELIPDGDQTNLNVEVSGLPLDMLFAFGAGWHTHLEGLGAYLEGEERSDRAATWIAKWEELAPSYREMTVEPLVES